MVRDYLNEHKDVSKEYSNFKEKSALKFPYDINEYYDGKEDAVKLLVRNALKWYNSKNS